MRRQYSQETRRLLFEPTGPPASLQAGKAPLFFATQPCATLAQQRRHQGLHSQLRPGLARTLQPSRGDACFAHFHFGGCADRATCWTRRWLSRLSGVRDGRSRCSKHCHRAQGRRKRDRSFRRTPVCFKQTHSLARRTPCSLGNAPFIVSRRSRNHGP